MWSQRLAPMIPHCESDVQNARCHEEDSTRRRMPRNLAAVPQSVRASQRAGTRIHREGVVHRTRADAENHDEKLDGKTTESSPS
jgi:hypothetical protein